MKPTIAYIPQLDGIRAIAISLVVAAHLGLSKYISGGFGVLLFFFISGYLISQILLSEHQQLSLLKLKYFYRNRIIRLYPPLILMVLLLTSILYVADKPININEVFAGLLYFENYFIVYNLSEKMYFQILWSLAVEEHFYIFYPLILIILAKKNNYLLLVLIILTIAPLIFRICFLLVTPLNNYSVLYTYYLTHCRFDSIMWGCLLSVIVHSSYAKEFLLFTSKKIVVLLGVTLLVFTFILKGPFFQQTFRYTLQGLALLILMPEVLYHKQIKVFNKLLCHFFLLRFIGKISYSIYLFHWVVLLTLNGLHLNQGSFAWYGYNLFLTLLLSTLSYFLLEVPMQKLKRRIA